MLSYSIFFKVIMKVKGIILSKLREWLALNNAARETKI